MINHHHSQPLMSHYCPTTGHQYYYTTYQTAQGLETSTSQLASNSPLTVKFIIINIFHVATKGDRYYKLLTLRLFPTITAELKIFANTISKTNLYNSPVPPFSGERFYFVHQIHLFKTPFVFKKKEFEGFTFIEENLCRDILYARLRGGLGPPDV